jgi:hypothetical protein
MRKNVQNHKKGKVPLSWRCGDASWVSWYHSCELCGTGCVLCDSLTWPSLQHENETVNDHTETTWSAFITRRGCWWWNGRADLIAKSGCGRDDKWPGQTLILWWLYTNRWSQKNCPIRRPCLRAFVVVKLKCRVFSGLRALGPCSFLRTTQTPHFMFGFVSAATLTSLFIYLFIYLCCCFVLTNIYKHK